MLTCIELYYKIQTKVLRKSHGKEVNQIEEHRKFKRFNYISKPKQ